MSENEGEFKKRINASAKLEKSHCLFFSQDHLEMLQAVEDAKKDFFKIMAEGSGKSGLIAMVCDYPEGFEKWFKKYFGEALPQ